MGAFWRTLDEIAYPDEDRAECGRINEHGPHPYVVPWSNCYLAWCGGISTASCEKRP